MNRFKKNTKKILLATTLIAGSVSMANAGLMVDGNSMGNANLVSPGFTLQGHIDSPRIVAGDTPGGEAPLVPSGAYSGVVSINIRHANGDSFICTGAAISKRHVVTAAHCIDSTGTGVELDISDPNADVRAVFTEDSLIVPGGLITATQIDIHPDYIGFGICGPGDMPGLGSQCLNDDMAVITLGEDIPATAEIYDFFRGNMELDGSTMFEMVGHGTGGNGIDGFIAPPSFFNKRFGFNMPEIFACDDATSGAPGGYTSTAFCDANWGNQAEVWRADFDGIDANGVLQDTWCDAFGICGDILSADITDPTFEANIGGGDSGGPSFIRGMMNELLLIGNNTFGSGNGAYGSTFGGNLYAPYLAWIDSFIKPMNASAPATLGFIALTLGALVFGRKRRVS